MMKIRLFLTCIYSLLAAFTLIAQTPESKRMDWLRFEARPQRDAIRLTWDLKKEQNTRHYQVERSVGNPNHFESIATVPIRDSQLPTVSYAYNDKKPPINKNLYYRLRIFDQDGKEIVSAWQKTSIQDYSLSLSVSPNPGTAARLSVSSDFPQSLQLFVLNILGQCIYQQYIDVPNGVTAVDLPTTKLPKGIYLIRAEAEGVKPAVRWVRE